MPDSQPADPLLAAAGSTSPPTVSVPDAVAVGGEAPPFHPPIHPGDLGRLGKYRVLKEVGRGGMGAVFLGYDDDLRRRVALKVMLPRFAASPTAADRFLREARAAAAVRSDHVVTIFEVGRDAGIPFIAMEYLQGVPLDQHLRQAGTVTLDQAVRIGREAAEGLAAAHEQGLVHRDVKPANLWLEAPNGRVKLLDFGLARAEEEAPQVAETPVEDSPSEAGTEPLTRTGAVLGTPAYMSPEQARGKKLDHRSDLFSLGGLLYRLLTGRLPFPGQNQTEVLLKLAQDDPVPVRELNPAVPEPLAALVHRLLAKDPAARPDSAREVASELEAGAGSREVVYVPLAVEAQADSVWEQLDEPSTAVTDAPPRSKPPARPRWPVAVVTGVLGVLVVAGAVLLAAKALRRPADDPPSPDPTPAVPPDDGGNGPVDPPPGPAESPLFPGPDLAEWKGDSGVWRLENGVLAGENKTNVAQHLVSEQRFRDFELACQVRVWGDKPNGHLRFRTQLTKTQGPVTDAVSLHAGPGGFALFGQHGKGRGAVVKAQRSNYHDVVVKVLGKRVTITVDGAPVVAEEAFDLPADGPLAFSVGPGAGLTVRVTRFTDLSRSPTDAAFLTGTDLAGWVPDSGRNYWKAEAGALTGAWPPGAERSGSARLVSDRTYRDFELAFRFRPAGKSGPVTQGVSGPAVLLRTRPEPENPKTPWFGLRCNLGPKRYGTITRVGPGLGKDPGLRDELDELAARGGFTEVVIRCEGKHVRTTVGGTVVTDADFPDLPDEGHLIWQFGSPTDGVTFKDIRFLDLTQALEPNFLTPDLAGWEPVNATWQVEGGVLAGTRSFPTYYGRLSSRRSYRDFELTFEARTPPKEPTSLRFRKVDRVDTGIEISVAPGQVFQLDAGKYTALAPTTDEARQAVQQGQFNQYRVRVVGRRVTVWVNGRLVSDKEHPAVLPEGQFVWIINPECSELKVQNVRLYDLSRPALAALTSPDWEWTAPESPGPGVNSAAVDEDPAITPDGLRLVFASGRDGRKGLYEATRKSAAEPFGAVRRLIEFDHPDGHPSTPYLSADGRTLVYAFRPAGGGGADLWAATRKDPDAPWGMPEPLGPAVNSPADEQTPALSPDGLTLYFASDRAGADMDLYACRRAAAGEPWGKPERLGEPVSTPAFERNPRPLADGRGLLFSRRRDRSAIHHVEWLLATPRAGGGWEVRPVGESENPAFNNPAFTGDGRTAVFEAARPGGEGALDLWIVRRVPKVRAGGPVVEALTSPEWEWSKPENLGAVNSPQIDDDAAVSADGLCLVFKSEREAGKRKLLYEARRKSTDEPFGEPAPVAAVNHPTADSGQPYLSADGLTLLFGSNNRGGASSFWVSRRANRDAPWGEPTNLGAVFKLPGEQKYVSLSPDERTVYFCHKGAGTADFDIWVSRRPDREAAWGPPEPLAGANTARAESNPKPTADGRGLLFYRHPPAGPITWHLAVLGPDGRCAEVRDLPPVPGAAANTLDKNPLPSADGRTVYFDSGRAGGRGAADLWLVRRVPKAKPPER